MKQYQPQTLTELYQALRELSPESKILGGGTDLILHFHSGNIQPDNLLYMGDVADARLIVENGDQIQLGAAATMRELAASSLLQGPLRAIAQAAADVGSQQIRNKATLGGNVANASPAGDLILPLFLLAAQAEIATAEGRVRTLSLPELVLGPGRTALAYNEALLRFQIDRQAWQGYRSAFVKLGFRQKVTISRIGLALALKQDESGLIEEARVYAGAISLTPVRLPQTEQLLRGQHPTEALAAQMAEQLSALIREITPEEFDRDYKVEAARGICADILAQFA